MKTRECLNCGHNQELKKDNVYQDIEGEFVVCRNCEATFNVENDNYKNIIKETLEEHAETNVQSIHYTIIEHEDEDFTIEVTDFTVLINGRLVVETAWEYNQSLTDDLNELLFTYIDEFKQGNEFGVIDVAECTIASDVKHYD